MDSSCVWRRRTDARCSSDAGRKGGSASLFPPRNTGPRSRPRNMPPQSEGFSKARRIRHREEFQRVFDFSLRAKGRYVTVLVAANESGTARLGIVASRKLGDAVRRNRAKRLIREVFRRGEFLPPGKGFDVVIIPRRELFDALYSSLESDVRGTITRCAARLPVTADVAR
jgi:ribonuclease P protein component